MGLEMNASDGGNEGLRRMGASSLRYLYLVGIAAWFVFGLQGCAPYQSLVANANVKWSEMEHPGACPQEFPYRVAIRKDSRCDNRTALSGAHVYEVCRVIADSWVDEMTRSAERNGCAPSSVHDPNMPVLSVTLRDIRIEGGASNLVMAIATIYWVFPGIIYGSWLRDHAVTVRADVEFRHRGSVLWKATLYGRKDKPLRMWSRYDLIYDEKEKVVGHPMREAFERMIQKIFDRSREMNAKLRG